MRKVFQWREPTEKIQDFDAILYRGDHNANTQGLLNVLEEFSLTRALANEFDTCLDGATKEGSVLIALCPELPQTFPSLRKHLEALSSFSYVSLWTSLLVAQELSHVSNLIPLKTFFEKKGTVLNFKKLERKLKTPYESVVFGAKDVSEAIEVLRTERLRLGKV